MFLMYLLLLLLSLVSSHLTFLAVGDWGGKSDDSPTTPAQVDDASGMGFIADKINIDFVTLLGDNFYFHGIQGDETCPRFEETFEKVYKAKSLQVPFYAIAGNHDHKGNVSAQISYSALSKRWKYPDSYYGIHKTIDNTSLDIFFIDTVILAGNNEDNEKFGLDEWENPHGPIDQAAADTQWAWLEKAMANSTAEYLWVAGHYPVWSACSHGPTSILTAKLKPLLEKYNGHYMCGHDHCMGHIDEGTGVQYIMTGAGKACCYDANKVDQNPKDSIKWWMSGSGGSGYQPMPFEIESGFTSFQVSAKSMKVVFYAHNGTELYTVPDIKPRNQSIMN